MKERRHHVRRERRQDARAVGGGRPDQAALSTPAETARNSAAAPETPSRPQGRRRSGVLRTIGLGLITGAADDDPSAIGTYASAGARFGPAFLWTAPVTFPMMVAVVYLSAKLGQVAGEGLFAVLKRHYSRWLLYPVLTGVLIGNVIEAGADIGGVAAALNVVVPLPIPWIVVLTTAFVLALQLWGSYSFIRNVLRVLALSLLAYVGSAFLAHPNWGMVLRGTLVPSVHFDRDFLAMIVAVIGTSLSAYLYTWQSNQEVEEEIALGRRRLSDRVGATDDELRHSWWDVTAGMFFSNVVMYFIILSTAATLFVAGRHNIDNAAQAAEALRPIAGNAAGVLFALGVVGVGLLAVPVMTTGAAYDLSQALGWKQGLNKRPSEAKRFYAAITCFMLVAMGMNFFGINPMKALVWAGIVQGFSTPPLLFLILRMTNNRAIMGERVNGRALNALAYITTAAIFAASFSLIVSWIL
jgi:NRAMP (natural resistance-associated macrophage protein)-like metal ion transporter